MYVVYYIFLRDARYTHVECVGHIQYNNTYHSNRFINIVFVFVICRFHGTDFYTHLVNALTAMNLELAYNIIPTTINKEKKAHFMIKEEARKRGKTNESTCCAMHVALCIRS